MLVFLCILGTLMAFGLGTVLKANEYFFLALLSYMAGIVYFIYMINLMGVGE